MQTIEVDPEECVRQRTVEQIGNVPVPQFREQIAETVTVILQKRISWCVYSENLSKNGGEILLPVVPCAQRAHPSTLTLGASIPRGAPRVPERFDGACVC